MINLGEFTLVKKSQFHFLISLIETIIEKLPRKLAAKMVKSF